MAFERIEKISSRAVLINRDHIDTDQIIPARFLKTLNREGFGDALFSDWRYHADGSPNAEFNLDAFQNTPKILVSGENFGCGSSREHAVWALHDFGFRVIIAQSFADIFKNNAFNNGILPICLTVANYYDLISYAIRNPGKELHVDLKEQSIRLSDSSLQFGFEVNPFRKDCLMQGKDLIDFLLSQKSEIVKFEKQVKIKR